MLFGYPFLCIALKCLPGKERNHDKFKMVTLRQIQDGGSTLAKMECVDASTEYKIAVFACKMAVMHTLLAMFLYTIQDGARLPYSSMW